MYAMHSMYDSSLLLLSCFIAKYQTKNISRRVYVITGNRYAHEKLLFYFTSNRCDADLVITILSVSQVMSIVWPALKPASRSHLPHSSMLGKNTQLLGWRIKPLLQTVSRLFFAVIIGDILCSKEPLLTTCILPDTCVFYGLLYVFYRNIYG